MDVYDEHQKNPDQHSFHGTWRWNYGLLHINTVGKRNRTIGEGINKNKTLGIILIDPTKTEYNFETNFQYLLPFREDWKNICQKFANNFLVIYSKLC